MIRFVFSFNRGQTNEDIYSVKNDEVVLML